MFSGCFLCCYVMVYSVPRRLAAMRLLIVDTVLVVDVLIW